MIQTELQWRASLTASCFYAARGIIQGSRHIDSELARALSEPAHALAAEIHRQKLTREPFLDHLAALATTTENHRHLAEMVLIQAIGAGSCDADLVNRLTSLLFKLEQAFRQAAPNAAHDLALREEPLKQQWQARGPGMLAVVGRLTHPNVVPCDATVVLVHPAFGGGGIADLAHRSVRIEAVLADPHDQLPEVVRLGWLISQLNLVVPVFSERIPGTRLPRTAALAMIPPILLAAQEVELARYDPETVRLALRAWHLESLPEASFENDLMSWWADHCEKPSRMSVALTTLSRMLD